MILLIVQARTSSTRLPGKVAMPILGKAMLHQQLDRLKCCIAVDEICVATSVENSDTVVEDICKGAGVKCFRGNLNDVLGRFYQCARFYRADTIVRICGDCPLIDSQLIDKIIEFHKENKADYSTNCINRQYPDGQDVEVFSFSALEQAYFEAEKPSEREHVTPYIRESGRFSVKNFHELEDFSNYRMSVDYRQDFQLVKKVFEALYEKDSNFGLGAIVEYLQRHPEVVQLNSNIEINEGYEKSKALDKSMGYE